MVFEVDQILKCARQREALSAIAACQHVGTRLGMHNQVARTEDAQSPGEARLGAGSYLAGGVRIFFSRSKPDMTSIFQSEITTLNGCD
jgi:hypothetical protein